MSSKTVAELTVAELLQILQERAGGPIKKSKKQPTGPKKEVSAGVAAWNAYVTEVKTELGCSRKEAMAEASKRRAAGSEEHAAASAARRAKRDEHLAKKAGSAPAEPKPVAEKPVAEKPKRVVSPEHLAKMQAGAKAKREAKAAVAATPAPAPEAEEEWIRKTISGKKHLWNPSNNHCYRCETDGSQGEWAGLYDPKSGKIDDSVEEPVDFEELPLCSDCGERPVTAKGHRYCEPCK
jgi:hypothetical protein